MDDFRVGSTTGLNAYRETGDRDARKRKKNKPSDVQQPEDEFVSSSADADDSVEDFYTPSEGSED